LAFDGVNDWVTVADAPSLDMRTAMSVEAWVYPTLALSSWRQVLMKETPSYFTYALYANTDTDRPSGHVFTSGDLDTRGSAKLPVNAWTHLSATWDGATLRLYQNGVLASSRAVAGSMVDSSGPLRLGGNAVWSEWFTGRLDEIRVYNRALSAAEIQTDMNTAVSSSGPPPSDTTPPTVAVTAPAAGATVTGTVSVTANASDNVAVAGVQFRLDGADLGAEDTTAPYSVSWNSATTSNGPHTLTAVARDAAGNTTVSNGVAVTVQSASDPALVGSWSAPESWPLVAVHMSLLPNGNVLAYDGFSDAPNSQRVWSPQTDAFASVPYGRNLFCAGHLLLADGRVLVVGGHVAPYDGLRDATLFNAATNTWSRASDMQNARWYPSSVLLGDGRALVLGGDNIAQDRSNQPHPLEDASVNSLPEVFDPTTGNWQQLTGSTLTTPLYPFMFVMADGRVFVAGPDTQSRILNPANWQWSNSAVSPVDGMSAVMYRPNQVMKSGSWSDPDFNGSKLYQTTNRTAVIDLSAPTPQWRETAGMAFGRGYHNLTLLPDGTVLASGGGSNSDGVDITKSVLPAEIWNPDSETWRTVAPLQNGRLYHSTALLLPDGRVLMAGGGQLPGSIAVNQRNAEIYSPPYLFKGPRPTIASAPSVLQYGGTFQVATPSPGSIAKVALIRTPSVTHAFDQNQRYVPLSFNTSGGVLNVTAPANANLAPPGYYMLFLVDSNGVPSTAAIVRFPAATTDTTPPTVPSGLTATGGQSSVALSWTASTDIVGVHHYNVHRGTTAGFLPSVANRIAQPTGTTYTDSGLTGGVYFYKVTAEDAAGNVSAASNEAIANVGGDTTPPTVSVSAPTSGASVSGTVTLAANASDDVAVAGVRFKIDGSDVSLEDITAPYQVSWDSSSVANGQHAVTAVARDGAGNTTTSAGITITVSNAAPPASGLAAAYSFNETTVSNVLDSSGNGNVGTISGATRTTAGKYGGALTFDGVNDWVTVPDASSLDLRTALTVEAWVYPTSTLSRWRQILLKETSNWFTYAVYANTDSNAPSGHVFTSSDQYIEGTSRLAVNSWSHVATTWDGATLRLYVNGSLVSSRAVSGTMADSAGPLRIGGNAIWGEWFQGRLDEIRIYGRALSPAELAADMNAALP
jgi:hypothetical protein